MKALQNKKNFRHFVTSIKYEDAYEDERELVERLQDIYVNVIHIQDGGGEDNNDQSPK